MNVFPCDTCNAECCGPVPFTKQELKLVRKSIRIPQRLVVPFKDAFLIDIGSLSCYFLKDNRCAIYDMRPKICRIFGTIPALACPKVKPKY